MTGRVRTCEREREKVDDIDNDYFGSYADIGIHHSMLSDRSRTETYYNAFKNCQLEFENAVVLDVGAGTGILSLMVAKLGAKKVYAVEASSLAKAAQDIVDKNGYSDTIEVIHSRVEDVNLPEKVDIIISEWMGYFLFLEGMFKSVMVARDRWLKPDGLMFPSKAKVFVEGFQHPGTKQDYCDYWTDVYGFDYTCLVPSFTQNLKNDVQLVVCSGEDIMTNECKIADLDLYKITSEDLKVSSTFELTGIRDGELHGILGWFDVEFPKPRRERKDNKKRVILSTSPWEDPTHWEQSAMFCCIDKNVYVKLDRKIEGRIEITPNDENYRCYDVKLKTIVKGDGDELLFDSESVFKLR